MLPFLGNASFSFNGSPIGINNAGEMVVQGGRSSGGLIGGLITPLD